MQDKTPEIGDFPVTVTERIRYNDTDRHGHVNNAVFSTFLEVARVSMVHENAVPLVDDGAMFVIARLTIDFRAEILWPGHVEIGTRILAVGRSSLTLEQAIFQNGKCAAQAESIMVQMDGATRKSRPFSEDLRLRFAAFAEAAG